MMNEIFWKVYHNKFIRSVIFNQIEQVQHIDEKRIKFKHIYKLGWMLKNKQYQLLKCKLLNGEYIEVDSGNETLKLLFSMDQETIDTELQLFKDLLQLVVNDDEIKRESIYSDLLSNAFEFSNLRTCNVLFEWLKQVDIEPAYSDNVFERILYNKNHQFELLKHFSTIVSTIKKQDHQLSNFDLYGLIDTNPNTIIQQDIKKGITNYIYNSIIIDNNQDTIETLIIYIRLFKKNKEPLLNNQDENGTIKQLLKEFIILSNSKKLYKYYLENYDESITGYDDTTFYSFLTLKLKIQHCKYTFKHFSFNTIDSIEFDHFDLLKYGYGYKTKKPITPDIFYKTNEIITSNLSRSIQFLKQYYIKLDQFKVNEERNLKSLTVYLIFNVLFATTSKESYEYVVSLIPVSLHQYLPIGWDPIILEFNNRNVPIIIKDCNTIDWLKHCYNVIKTHCNLIYFVVILIPCFQTVKLAQYALSQTKNGLEIAYFGHLFNKAIKECDFGIIVEINSIRTQSLKTDIDILSKYKFKSSASFYDYNQLFNFIISEKMIEPISFLKLVEYIANNGWYSNTKDKSMFYFDLSKININLSFYNYWQVKILYHLDNVKYIQFILENVQISTLDNNFSRIYVDNFTPTQAIDSIYIFINEIDKKLERYLLLNSTPPSELSNELSTYYKYLNLIFFHLLRCMDVTIGQINQMYQLIYIKYKIPIQQIDYHPYHFISLKSSILSLHVLDSLSDNVIIHTLSFESLYNSSFDEILQYSTNIDGLSNGSDIHYQINLNLHLFLNLKRIDLFFNQLEHCNIKSVQFNHLLIEQCCIVMDLDSVIKFTNISNFYLNKPFFLKMTLISLKLSKFSTFKHLFKYSINGFDDYDDKLVNYINNNNSDNDDLFLKSNQKLLIHKINKYINQIK